jgi:hypothetical protein
MRVVNASPLIHLARVFLLELLRDPRHGVATVVVPTIVFEEVIRGAGHDPTAGLVDQATRDWLTIVPTPPPGSWEAGHVFTDLDQELSGHRIAGS